MTIEQTKFGNWKVTMTRACGHTEHAYLLHFPTTSDWYDLAEAEAQPCESCIEQHFAECETEFKQINYLPQTLEAICQH